MENASRFITHPSEEMLEEYCFNRLPEEITDALEDHLFVCAHCQAEIQDLDEYILLMKLAIQELISDAPEPARLVRAPLCAPVECKVIARRDPPRSPPQRPSVARWERFRLAAAKPRLSGGTLWATALGLTCVVGLMFLRSVPAQATIAVPLSAFRGGGDAAIAHAPASRPLDLQADISDLPGARLAPADLPGTAAYRFEIVDAAGEPIWNQIVPVANGTLSAHLPKGLHTGTYWVRLYARSGELLREFSLRLDDPSRGR